MNKEVQDTLIDKLNAVTHALKGTFVGKDDIIDLMAICLVGRENLFLLGPPGTAKSAMVRQLAKRMEGQTFEYLLTRFTEPNELFGPFDIRKLREGELITNTEGMLPEANMVFLDELLNANSAILNSLLMVLNERIFRRGRETKAIPALMFVGASNHLPEDEALQALFDRFLIRVRCGNIDPLLLENVLQAGWVLEQKKEAEGASISHDEVRQLQQHVTAVNLDGIRSEYIDLIRKLRNAGVAVSDRRAVKLQRLVAASAMLCKRDTALLSDLWVLRYIWDTEEQLEIIAGIVNTVCDSKADTDNQVHHPRSSENNLPDAEELFKEVEGLSLQWADENTTAAEKSIIKDRLRFLSSRSEWISNETQRQYVEQPINALWQTILQQNE